jgi:hypothetical protein
VALLLNFERAHGVAPALPYLNNQGGASTDERARSGSLKEVSDQHPSFEGPVF